MFRLSVLVVVMVFGSVTAGVAAEEASSSAGEFITPDPAECTVEPRSLDSILAISGTPPPDLRTPVSLATPGLQVPDDGEPADPATVAAVTATIHELVACENAGDQLRRFAFYTDNVLWNFETQQPLLPEEKIAMFGGTPAALPLEQFVAVRVGEVRVLPGGEVVAVVERRMAMGTATIVYVLIQEGDRYLIDHAMDEVFEPVAGDQRVASPAASNGGSIVARFDPGAGEFPEGVAVAPDGAVYASLSTLGQLVRIVPDGGYEVAGTVAGLQDGDPGLLGLAASADGSVYGAVVSANADARGVWRFDVETGAAERLPGTEAITFPNAIAIDSGGGLYVTDALGAAVWRVGPDGLAAIWVQGDLLAGAELPGVDFPIGANGIALDEDAGTVYVAVSTQGTVVEIPMLDDGLAGEPAMHTAFTNDQGMVGVDGVALDGRGNLYVAQPVANVVVRVAPDGTVEPVATVADGLDGPTSVAVGTGAGGIERLYIASWSDALGDLAPPDGGGPTVVMVPLDSAGHGRPAPGDW